MGIMALLLFINSYLYGYLSGVDKNQAKPFVFESKIHSKTVENDPPENTIKPSGDFVASKSGTRVYYIWCSGVNRIKPENRRYFATLDEALKEGYKPASNCPGL